MVKIKKIELVLCGLALTSIHTSFSFNPLNKQYQQVIEAQKKALKEYRNKRYNEVTFPCSHNAQSNIKGALISVQNQEKTITEQFNAGIRGMKLPIYLQDNTVYACHGVNQHTSAAVKDAIDNLREIPEKTKSKKTTKKVGNWLKRAGKTAAVAVADTVAEVAVPDKITDIYYHPEKVKPCDIDPGADSLESIFKVTNNFLDKNPNEIITLFLNVWTSYKSGKKQIVNSFKDEDDAIARIYALCQKTGVSKYLYQHDNSKEWPTIQTLINKNKRLVVFINYRYFDLKKYPFNRQDSSYWSSEYDFSNTKKLLEDYPNSPPNSWKDSISRTWTLQHFVTDKTGGSKKAAQIVNKKENILARVNLYKNKRNLPNPTFIWVDFFNVPSSNGIFEAVRELNGL